MNFPSNSQTPRTAKMYFHITRDVEICSVIIQLLAAYLEQSFMLPPALYWRPSRCTVDAVLLHGTTGSLNVFHFLLSLGLLCSEHRRVLFT
ncbi:hypothetical protein FKM82_022488 [Ascaphus truei]